MVSALPSMAAAAVHGGRLIAAQRAFPDAPLPWIDLSTGISPFAYPIGAIPDTAFHRLPEPEQEAALRAVAARAYGAPDADHVCLAPGSQMLISLLPRLLRCRQACVLHPGYAEHEHSWRQAGADMRRAGTAEALHDAAAVDTVLVLCNPNNPDGRRVDRGGLEALAERCQRIGGWLVVDEAYADLENGVPPAASMLARFERVVVLRSLGKSYGLAGVRFGALLAQPSVVAQMAALLGPWPVSGAALILSSRALADGRWREAAAERACRESRRLEALLVDTGMTAVGGTALFRLASVPDAQKRWRLLAGAGLLARRFEDHADWLRFGLPPDEAAWTRLRHALSNR